MNKIISVLIIALLGTCKSSTSESSISFFRTYSYGKDSIYILRIEPTGFAYVDSTGSGPKYGEPDDLIYNYTESVRPLKVFIKINKLDTFLIIPKGTKIDSFCFGEFEGKIQIYDTKTNYFKLKWD